MVVQDLRVSHQLARLGGVYRDPARVERDTSILLKASVGQHLQPITAVYVDSNGISSTVLVLQGTIAIHFRGNTYQLLIDMYMIAGYPMRPPVCYVRLADPSMYLKPNHKHVGSDGKIYLPYLHEWKASTHNLVELVIAMSSVFSAEPPVFSRPTPPAVPPPPPLPEIRTSHTTTTTSSSNNQTNNNKNPNVAYSNTMNGTSSVVSSGSYQAAATSSSSQQPYDTTTMTEQQQLEFMLARDAAEANEAAEIARKLEEMERQKEELERIQKHKDMMRLNELRTALTQKVRQYCYTQSQNIQTNVQQDWKDSELLNKSQQHKISYQMTTYEKLQQQYNKHNTIVLDKIENIKKWLEDNDKLMSFKQQQEQTNATTNSNGSNGIHPQSIDINRIIQPANPLQKQMIELSAENMAIEDVYYNLNRCLYDGKIDCVTHLKCLRKIAKQQFFVRALMIKIQRIQQQQHQDRNAPREFTV